MAQRRCFYTLTRQAISLLFSNPASLSQSLRTLPYVKTLITSKSPLSSSAIDPTWLQYPRHFSSNSPCGSEHEQDDEDDEEGDEEEEEDSDGVDVTPSSDLKREYSTEEKAAEAAAIGYKVVGPLQRSDWVFKQYEPVFAVVQIGSHQFKVSNGDSIFTERLKFCEVNDKLILSKVLLLGSSTQTIVGRPIVLDAAVHAVVEEHALDAKVIIFKKKRRKNYRRTKGHRQELTKLRITDIQGIEKPKTKVDPKPKKATFKEQEKVAVDA